MCRDASPDSTSLDPQKESHIADAGVVLTGHWPPHPDYRAVPATTWELRFRHSGTAGRRRLIWDALIRTHRSSARLDRFAECGSMATVELSPKGNDARIRSSHCHDRFCPACGNSRAAVVSASVAALIDPRTHRFVTLTRRHSAASLSDQIGKLKLKLFVKNMEYLNNIP